MKNIDDEILFKLVKDHLNKSYHERKDKVIHGGTGLTQPAQWYRDFARAVVDVALKDLVLEHEAIKSQQRLPQVKAINPLTDEQLSEIAKEYTRSVGCYNCYEQAIPDRHNRIEDFARAIERAHGIGATPCN